MQSICKTCGVSHECLPGEVSKALLPCGREPAGGLIVQVTDKQTGEGIEGVTVKAVGLPTGRSGFASKDSLPAGSYPIYVEPLSDLLSQDYCWEGPQKDAAVQNGALTLSKLELTPICCTKTEKGCFSLIAKPTNNTCSTCALSATAKAGAQKMSDAERKELATAFQNKPFIYGTAGAKVLTDVVMKLVGSGIAPHQRKIKQSESTIKSCEGLIAELTQRRESSGSDPAAQAKIDLDLARYRDMIEKAQVDINAEQKTVEEMRRLEGVYDPGIRANAYMAEDGNQMMDLYYGQFGTTTFQQRNPIIGKYVHLAMEFAGDYSQGQAGFDSFYKTFGRVAHPDGVKPWRPSGLIEGWDSWAKTAAAMQPINDSMAKYGMTATKYMSKMIREAVQCFGGTLVFDGADVFYEAVFSSREKIRVGDTAEEARALFPEFAKFPGESSVKWGRGTLIFHWRGKETPPTQALFRESWQYIGDRKGGAGGPLTHQKESTLESYESGIIFGEFESEGKKIWGLHQAAPRTELLNELWRQFPEGEKRDTSLSPETQAAYDKHLEQSAKEPAKTVSELTGSYKAKLAQRVEARKAKEAAEKEAAAQPSPAPPASEAGDPEE